MKTLFLLSVMSLSILNGNVYHLDSDDSVITAHVKGTAGLSVEAKNTHLTVDDTDSKLKFTLQSNQFETGISLRDDHTRKAIEADKYPNIILSFDDDSLHHPTSIKLMDKAKGTLTFHGITKQVDVSYSAKNNCKGKVEVAADFDIDMRDYKINSPSYMGIGLKPTISIHAVVNLLTDRRC